MDFKSKLMLAPMAGFTDRAFRDEAVRYGADIVISEMVSAKAMHYNDEKTAALAKRYEGDAVFGVQIFGHEPDIMANAAHALSYKEYIHKISDTPPDFIDINMGCPVKKIVTGGDGSALMKDPRLCEKIVRACVDASCVPVTVKIRAGWDADNISCTEVARAAEAGGASAIAIHARTREQMYEPYADWSYIRVVKDSVSIPVIGNGDIVCAADAVRMLDTTGCDSVMIGRGALGNPFIFDEIRHIINNKCYTPPTVSQRMDVAMHHIRMMCEDKGEQLAIREARKHLSHYTKGITGGAQARRMINLATSLDEIQDILRSLIKGILS